ncbi:hypothetical protein VTL71DRAFT_14542 [Oculimacula yallundae]|uniref:DNA2/NAM7 helicase helicase domain-containing protein n=1 Tax=Oculimacula yallundae TaxID=86028 RepID=A0ABR4CKU0_9HELO
MTKKRTYKGDAESKHSVSQTRDGESHLTTADIFERFLAAYRGERDDPLGADSPPAKFFESKECAVFLSTASTTRLLVAPDEETWYNYDTSSQNAGLEIQVREVNGTARILLDSVMINSEAMAAPLRLIPVTDPNSQKVRMALNRFIPMVTNSRQEIDDAIELWPSVKAVVAEDVECLVFTLKKSRLWVRKRSNCGKEVSMVAQRLKEAIEDLAYITILRKLAKPDQQFIDKFWEYQLERCLRDGIYWGYRLKQEMPKLSNGENYIPYTHQVLRGLLPAPHLPWFKCAGSQPNTWLSHPYKATFTSIQEWEAVFTLALLQNVEPNRLSVIDTYAFSNDHFMLVEEDEIDPLRFLLHVSTSTSTGTPLPQVPNGTIFRLNNMLNTDAKHPLQTLKARAIDIKGCNHLVLELRVKGQKRARPWGEQFRTGFRTQVSLNPSPNVEWSLRQLNAIESLGRTRNKVDLDVLIGRPARNHNFVEDIEYGMPQRSSKWNHPDPYSDIDSDSDMDPDINMDFDMRYAHSTILSEKRSSTPKSRLPFQEMLARLRYRDSESFQSYIEWQLTNEGSGPEYQSVKNGLRHQVSFVQGAQGTGKSRLACTVALWVACLRKHVLMTTPSKAAAKSNASKLCKSLSQLSWILRHKLHCVYFPTWKESIDRIYEDCKRQMPATKQPGDHLFKDIHLWHRVYEYACERHQVDKKDVIPRKFIDAVHGLRAESGHESSGTYGRNELTLLFKDLTRQYLSRNDINFVVITTCINCAALKVLPIKFDYLVIDDADVGTEPEIAVALQIKHEGVLVLGDQNCARRPVIQSKGHNDFYNQVSVTGFERALKGTDQERTTLRISYNFGEQPTDDLTLLRKSGGVAFSVPPDSAFYQEYEALGASNERPYPNIWIHPPVDARHHRIVQRGLKKFHRIAFNVADSYSSLSVKGNSTVNYGNVDAGISLLLYLVENLSTLTGKDIMVGTPFAAQADVWRQQLNIRWPNSGVEIVTDGIWQGKRKKVMVSDFTIVDETEGPSLGLLNDWIRSGMLEFQQAELMVSLFNFDVMRLRLESLHQYCPTLAYILLDHLDFGEMYTVSGSNILPASAEEYRGARECWTLTQAPSEVYNCNIPLQKIPGRDTDGKERFTPLERRILDELADLRKKASVEMKANWRLHREWEKEWETEKKRLSELLEDDEL